MTPDQRFLQIATHLGFDPAAEIKIGGNYTALLRCDDDVFVSGQIPRIGEQIAVVGTVGAEVSLAEAQRAAQISAVRALALLQRELGALARVRQILRAVYCYAVRPALAHHACRRLPGISGLFTATA